MVSKLIGTVCLLFVSVIPFILNGCSYSFTGASVPPHLESIAIPLAKDVTSSGEANLRENFTNELINKFIDDNTLQVTDKTNADALLECTIQSISDAPAIVSENDEVDSRKITISVKVLYRDLVKRKTIFDRSFSNFSTYLTEDDFITARNNAIENAIDKLAEDILLGVVSNW